jgi:hypothetical protein
MSNRIKGLDGKPAQQTIDVEKLLASSTPVACDQCGNQTFQEVVILRKLSAVASPSGKEANVPIPTFACNNCNWVNMSFLPPFMRVAIAEEAKAAQAETEAQTVTKSSLILGN